MPGRLDPPARATAWRLVHRDRDRDFRVGALALRHFRFDGLVSSLIVAWGTVHLVTPRATRSRFRIGQWAGTIRVQIRPRQAPAPAQRTASAVERLRTQRRDEHLCPRAANHWQRCEPPPDETTDEASTQSPSLLVRPCSHTGVSTSSATPCAGTSLAYSPACTPLSAAAHTSRTE